MRTIIKNLYSLKTTKSGVRYQVLIFFVGKHVVDVNIYNYYKLSEFIGFVLIMVNANIRYINIISE